LGVTVPYCLTGDTNIKIADGTVRSIKSMVDDGIKDFEVYCINENGKLTTSVARKPRLTRRNSDLVEVFLDNKKSFRCTPDHRVMLRDGSYCEAQNLKKNQSLMPCYMYKLPSGYIQHE